MYDLFPFDGDWYSAADGLITSVLGLGAVENQFASSMRIRNIREDRVVNSIYAANAVGLVIILISWIWARKLAKLSASSKVGRRLVQWLLVFLAV